MSAVCLTRDLEAEIEKLRLQTQAGGAFDEHGGEEDASVDDQEELRSVTCPRLAALVLHLPFEVAYRRQIRKLCAVSYGRGAQA